jgi:hypothetical protein
VDKIAAAAIERLEAERQRRVEERIAQGKAIRVPLCVVVEDPGQVEAEIESAKADKLAELRKAGETREIVFDEPMVIDTGVPRDADFGKDWAPLPPADPYDRHAVASDEPPKPAITRPSEADESEPYEGPRLWQDQSCAQRKGPRRSGIRSPTPRTRSALLEATYAPCGHTFGPKVYAPFGHI